LSRTLLRVKVVSSRLRNDLKQTDGRSIQHTRRRFCLGALLGALALAAVTALPAQARDLVVYGEPTLKPVLTTLGALWRAKGNSRVHVFVAPTDLSFEQIARETRCDVIFALAGPVTDAAEARELFDADSRIDAFRNSLVLVVRAGWAVPPGLVTRGKRFAIANPDRDVAGSYGLQALRAAGIPVDPGGKDVMVAESAAGVLQLLADRQADIGLVYASDATAHPQFNVLERFDSASYPPIVYVAAQAAHADDDADSEGFIDFLTTPEAKAAIAAAGLTPVASKTAQAQPRTVR
jgi:molybdate transport system substrate-binding protein